MSQRRKMNAMVLEVRHNLKTMNQQLLKTKNNNIELIK